MDKTIISKMILADLGFKPGLKPEWYHCTQHSDNTASFHADLKNGIGHCFACNYGGSLCKMFYEVRGVGAYKYFDLDNPNSKKEFNSDFEIPKESIDPDMKWGINPPEVKMELKGHLIPAYRNTDVLNFLRIRGLPIEIAKKYEMSYTEDLIIIDRLNKNDLPEDQCITSFKNNRLIIPIWEGKKVVSFEGRDIYFNRYNLPKDRYHKSLYPKGSFLQTLFEWEKLDTTKPLYLVEGLMDLFALRTNEKFLNSTTIFGAACTERQAYLLNKFKDVIYVRNADIAGEKSVESIIKKGYKGNLYTILPPEGCKDVNDIIDTRKLNSTLKEQLDKGWAKRMVKIN